MHDRLVVLAAPERNAAHPLDDDRDIRPEFQECFADLLGPVELPGCLQVLQFDETVVVLDEVLGVRPPRVERDALGNVGRCAHVSEAPEPGERLVVEIDPASPGRT